MKNFTDLFLDMNPTSIAANQSPFHILQILHVPQEKCCSFGSNAATVAEFLFCMRTCGCVANAMPLFFLFLFLLMHAHQENGIGLCCNKDQESHMCQNFSSVCLQPECCEILWLAFQHQNAILLSPDAVMGVCLQNLKEMTASLIHDKTTLRP